MFPVQYYLATRRRGKETKSEEGRGSGRGGRLVVHFIDRKNAPFLYFHMTGGRHLPRGAGVLERHGGREGPAQRGDPARWRWN